MRGVVTRPPLPISSSSARLALLALLLVPLSGCPSRHTEGPMRRETGPIFVDRAPQVGLEFTHTHGGTGELHFVETMAPGAAFIDYDNDGDLDIYLVQGHRLGPGSNDSTAATDASRQLTDRLFRNDVDSSRPGQLSFVDVTERSRIHAAGYGMGAATGDYDNDGWTDLYVTNFGPNQLWHNNADGTFSDVTQRAGAGDARWSAGATFFDVDRDGWLDLYVTNYVDYRLASARPCRSPNGLRDYCGPLSYEAEPGRLLRNSGDGTFEDVSGPFGVLAEVANGLGVVAADFDANGWLDLYVASDQTQNLLWMNAGDRILRNEALLSGTAVNRLGRAEAGMGAVAEDFDADGDLDIFVTHLSSETNTYYRNDGHGGFIDATGESGLGAPSAPFTGFGTAAMDFDNDGWLDLAVANGAVRIEGDVTDDSQAPTYHQPDQLYRNLGGGRFEEVDPLRAGLGAPATGRGLAQGDVDNDGDTDLLIANDNGPVRLFVNQIGQEEDWIGLRLIDRRGREAFGALVEARGLTGGTLWRRVHTDGSYCSARDPRIVLGLGDVESVGTLRVHWPGGAVESYPPPAANGYLNLIEGRGQTGGGQ